MENFPSSCASAVTVRCLANKNAMMNGNLNKLALKATAELKSHFGHEAAHVAAAPGRVNLIGEHIDYCDGFVLPFAIDRHTIIASYPNGKSVARIRSSALSDTIEIPLHGDLRPVAPCWENYVRGVLSGYLKKGADIPGFDACVVSSIPAGGGLSSSAALECAMATLIEKMSGFSLEPTQRALLCQEAEQHFVGVPCGPMDQLSSVLGETDHLLLIDCQSNAVVPIPFRNDEVTFVIANTHVKHSLADGSYKTRREQTEMALGIIGAASWRQVSMADLSLLESHTPSALFRRARHVVTEMVRTIDAADAIKMRDYPKLGKLMQESHRSLRYDFEVTCKELDLMVNIANDIGASGGVLGSRMTGGGFGGSTITVCDASRAGEVVEKMTAQYHAATGISADIFVSRPSAGAHITQ